MRVPLRHSLGAEKPSGNRFCRMRPPERRGIAEEAPGAYKNADAAVAVAEKAGLARRVAWLKPLICIKG